MAQMDINVETTTLFQPSFNLLSTLKPQRSFNIEITTSVQLSNTTIFQPYFTLMCDRCINVVVSAGNIINDV